MIRKSPTVSKPQDHLDLWQTYQATRSVELRNTLVELYRPAAQQLAAVFTRAALAEERKRLATMPDGCRAAPRLPAILTRETVQSDTDLELLKAVERYDLSTKVPFILFLRRRLRGLVVDIQRANGICTRGGRTAWYKAQTFSDSEYQRILDRLAVLRADPDYDGRFSWFTRGCPWQGRMALYLHFFSHYPVVKVGKILKVSEEAAGKLIDDAMAFIRDHRRDEAEEIFQEYGEEESVSPVDKRQAIAEAAKREALAVSAGGCADKAKDTQVACRP